MTFPSCRRSAEAGHVVGEGAEVRGCGGRGSSVREQRSRVQGQRFVGRALIVPRAHHVPFRSFRRSAAPAPGVSTCSAHEPGQARSLQTLCVRGRQGEGGMDTDQLPARGENACVRSCMRASERACETDRDQLLGRVEDGQRHVARKRAEVGPPVRRGVHRFL